MPKDNDPICICRYYRAEDGCCSFYDLQDLSDDQLREPCLHTECPIGCYESAPEYYNDQGEISWAELWGFETFHCSVTGITREFV